MLPHEIDDAIDRAFTTHVELLVQTLLTSHNPFNTQVANDEAVKRFEVGLKHFLHLRPHIEDTIARVVTERDVPE
jgi:hypothetical protein